MTERYDRNERLFGKDGQRAISACRPAIVGLGGLGSIVLAELLHLGTGRTTVIEDERIDESNLNRYLLAGPDDVGELKVHGAARLAAKIRPDTQLVALPQNLRTAEAFDALRHSDVIFGCVDNDGARFVLNELAAVWDKPYIDLATDVEPGETLRYGGRVLTCWRRPGCLICTGQIDPRQASRELDESYTPADHAATYGINQQFLGAAGPAVISINAVVASLAVTEFMVAITGMRDPKRLITYRGHSATSTVSADPPTPGCWFCDHLRGRPDRTDVGRLMLGRA